MTLFYVLLKGHVLLLCASSSLRIQKLNSRNGKIRSCKVDQLISNNLVLFVIKKKKDNLALLIFVFIERT